MNDADRYQLAVDMGTTEYYYQDLRKEIEPEALMNMQQVSRWLGKSPRTITRLVKSEKIKAFKVGNTWRFKYADIMEYIQYQREKLTNN